MIVTKYGNTYKYHISVARSKHIKVVRVISNAKRLVHVDTLFENPNLVKISIS